ncbi:MAG TPA: hypothetical protein VEA41_18400 [Salinarimonas sp.]|nr:hypothetical protein [Salinarimonas sp.]
MDKKKPGVAIILGLKKGEAKKEEAPAEEEESLDVGAEAKTEAAKAVLKAVKTGDVESLESALSSFIEACSGYGDEE